MQQEFRLEDDEYISDSESRLFSLATDLTEAANAIGECRRLRKEVEYWRKQYNDQLSQSIKHADAMMGNVLKLCTDGIEGFDRPAKVK